MNATLLVLFAALIASASAGAVGVVRGETQRTSAAIATDPLRGKAVFADPESGMLHVEDLATGQQTHAVVVGKSPGAVVVNAVSGKAYAIDDTAPGWIVAVDIESGRVLGRTAVGNRPSSLVADFPRGEIYVANRADGNISIVHAATLKVLAVVDASGEPSTLSVDARRGLLYAVSSAQRIVDVFDLDYRHAVGSIDVGSNPGTATVDETSGKVYVNNIGDRTVTVIDPMRSEVVRTIPSGAGSTVGTISDVHRRYYLPNADDNRVSIVDTRDDQLVALVQVGRGPQTAVLSSTEDEVYVLNRDDASTSLIDVTSDSLIRTVPTLLRDGFAIALDEHLMAMAGTGASHERNVLARKPIARSETALVTEYADASRQRYLHTASRLEARLIADGLFGDQWRRTMRFFRVWTNQEFGRVPVCRFSSAGDTDSNRVVVATAEECATLKADPAWIDEGVAYFVALPDANGSCAFGTEPLYQVRNDGVQRFVREVGVRDTMVNAGWTVKGHGNDTVYACVPALRANGLPDVSVDDTPDAPEHLRHTLRHHHR